MTEVLPGKCIFVENEDGASRIIPFTDSMTVKDLQDIIIEGSGIPKDSFILNFGKKNLIDEKKKLSQYEVKDLAVISFQVFGEKALFYFNKFENQSKGYFSSLAPDYRTMGRGLTMEAMCSNKNCRAFNKNILITMGFGDFNISRVMYECCCPACKIVTQTPAFNICYYKTKLSIHGKKDKEAIFKKTITAEDDQWHSFVNGDEQICKWNFLEIKAQKL